MCRLLIFLLIHSTLGIFVKKHKQMVHMENILDKVEGTSTSCYLKCSLNKHCVSYGTMRNILVGEVDDCYFIAESQSQYFTQDHGKTVQLYVVEMV